MANENILYRYLCHCNFSEILILKQDAIIFKSVCSKRLYFYLKWKFQKKRFTRINLNIRLNTSDKMEKLSVTYLPVEEQHTQDSLKVPSCMRINDLFVHIGMDTSVIRMDFVYLDSGDRSRYYRVSSKKRQNSYDRFE